LANTYSHITLSRVDNLIEYRVDIVTIREIRRIGLWSSKEEMILCGGELICSDGNIGFFFLLLGMHKRF